MAARQTPRWRRRKEDRPGEIVAAALELFAARGFAATRLEDIAKRAGVSKGTLYLYFRNKEELFKAVIQQELLPNLAHAEARLSGSDQDTAELLVDVISYFARTVATSRLAAIPKLVISEADNFPDLSRFYVDKVVTRGLGLVAAILERGMARGEIRPLDPKLAAPVIVGPMLLLALWKSTLEPHATWSLDPAAFLKTYEDMLLNGLRPTQPAPTGDEQGPRE